MADKKKQVQLTHSNGVKVRVSQETADLLDPRLFTKSTTSKSSSSK